MCIYGNGPSRSGLYARPEPSERPSTGGIRVISAPERVIRAAAAPLVRNPQKEATVMLARAALPASPEAASALPTNVELRWISAGTANVRAAPNKRSALAGKIGMDGAVHVMWTEPNGWVRIRTATGEVEGFVHKSLLTTNAPFTTSPELPASD